jgi:hypothetical protein
LKHIESRIAGLSVAAVLVLSALSFAPGVFADSQHNCQVPAQYGSIGAAYSAGCIKIHIAAGTYPEQLTITSPVTLQGDGPQSIIQPLSVTENAPATDEAAVIAVIGTTDVTITNLVVDGSLAATGSSPLFTSCAGPYYAGILFSDASGSIKNVQVENLYQSSPSLYGCQNDAGLAIDVESPTATSVVSIDGSAATNYQKNGITCNDAGSTCEISNDVTTPLAAATSSTGDGTNGIQVGFGAVADVSNNQVSGNECNVSVCGGNFQDPNGVNWGNDGSGILLYQAGGGTVVKNNQISTSDVGLAVFGPNAGVQIQNNHLTDNRYAGLGVEDGSYTAKNTQISSSVAGAYGVVVEALSSFGDGSGSATLQNAQDGLPNLTYATGSLTASIYTN